MARGTALSQLAVDAPLYAADEVLVGAGSEVVIRYRDGSEVTASEGSVLTLREAAAGFGVDIGQGTIVARGDKQKGGSFTVKGRFGQTDLVQGAEVRFDLSAGNDSMDVLFGDINVVQPDGGSAPLVAGETFEFALGRKKSPADVRPVVVADELQFRLAPLRGAPTVKPPGDKTFKALSQQGNEIAQGASFKVPKGAAAALTAPGLRLVVEEGAAGTVGAAKSVDGVPRHEVALDTGDATVTLKGAQLVLSAGASTLELSAKDSAVAQVQRTGKDGATVEVKLGSLSLKTGDKTEVLQANDVATFVGGKWSRRTAAAPALVLPASVRSRVVADGLRQVRLSFPKGTGAARSIEIARDAAFKDLVLAGEGQTDWVVVDAPGNGELHWRVEGDAASESHATFEPDKGRSILRQSSPMAEVNETGQKSSIFFQSAVPSITFAFASKPGARGYLLRVYRAKELTSPLVEQRVTEPRASLVAGKLREGDYLWSATPLGPGGAELQGGRMNKLELVYENATNSLFIARPRNNDRSAKKLRTEGIAPMGSDLFINGEQVQPDSKGRFARELNDPRIIIYRLVGLNGVESYWTRALR